MSNQYNNYTLEINENNCDVRADKALIYHDKINTRSNANKLFKLKLISINGNPIKPSYLTRLNDIIDIKVPCELPSALEPYDFDLDIIHEDNDLLIINKPAGLVMHPSAGHHSDSLVNALMHKNIKLSMGFNESRPGIVHRIDKDTSGLVVVAKNNISHENLAAQFKNKTVHRVYYALVHDYFKEDKGTIESYLIRHPVHRKKHANERLEEDKPPKGKKAVTHYDVLNYAKGISLVKCQLDTGRTHQIRVHLSELHHPIISDPIYSSSRWKNKVESKHVRNFISELNGIGLHARELGFIHPTSKKQLLFKSEWPERLREIISFLGWDSE